MSRPSETSTSTLSHLVQSRPSGRISAQPHLFLVLQADHPLGYSARYCLRDVEELAFGRTVEGGETHLERLDLASGAKLCVRDRWMSSSHAVMRRSDNSWTIEDKGSKNGTFVNGQRCERASLEEGDLVELGHSFFIFRAAISTHANAPAFVDTSGLRPAAAGMVTLLPGLAEQLANLEVIAPSSVSVVIHGESGTGKELIAQAIHRLSGRSGAFVAVNCASLPRTLVETELFGYRKGAFSGATEDRPGLVRAADKGTLFLDEIGDLEAGSQAVLLRVLQEHEVLPVGATRPVPVDIRVVAATHRDLEALVASGKFRGDLLARVSGLTLRLPPLRERREDLGLLIGMLLKRHFASRAEQIRFSSDAARALLLYDWPRNIRELEKCITAAAVLARGESVPLAHLPEPLRAALSKPQARPPPQPRPEGVAGDAGELQLGESDQRRREEILNLLREHSGNITAVARALGKARFQVQRWIKRYRIDTKEFHS